MMEVAIGIAEWLLRNRDPGGRIQDPVHGEHGTYADGFAALAFGLMALRTGERGWAEACHRSLEIARRRPPSSEFDHLARLLLALETAEPVNGGPLRNLLPADEKVSLSRRRMLVSHNWTAMRALSLSLRARLGASVRDKADAARLWARVLSWQLPNGLFVDSPGGEATPVAYHAKFCAMLALALGDTGSEELRAALERGLHALAALVSPCGVLVPYGRSRNTLFGYGAAILTFRAGAGLLRQAEYLAIAERLENRVRRFQQPDGHVPCVLNHGEAEKRDWDVYVNNPDYNAYAAAMLLLAGSRGSGFAGSAPFAPASSREPAEMRQIGPILTVQSGELFAAFATTGQSVPWGTPFFCDHRYYGMQPLWIEAGDRVLLEPAPYRWRGGEYRETLVDPTANGWIPYIEIGGRRYCVRSYDTFSVRQSGSTVEMEAEGRPEAYDPVPRWERGLHWLIGEWRGVPGPMFRRVPLEGIRVRRRLSWNPRAGTLRVTSETNGNARSAAALHQDEQEWTACRRARSLHPLGIMARW